MARIRISRNTVPGRSAAGLSADQLAVLQTVSTEVAAALDPPGLAELVVAQLVERFGYELPSVYFLEADGKLHLAAQRGYDAPIRQFEPCRHGVVGRVTRSLEPALVLDASQDPDFIGATSGLVAEVCVPILSHAQVIGIINVETRRQGVFSESDVTLLRLLAQMMAVSLRNADLYRAAQDELAERKRLLEQLRVSEEQYRTLFQESKDVLFITTPGPEGRILDVNPAGVELFGYPSQAVLLQTPVTALWGCAEDRVALGRALEQHGFVKDYPCALARRDGQPLFVLITASAERNAAGQVCAYRGFVHDVTARTQADAALRASEARFRGVFADAPIGIALVGFDGHPLEVNTALERMLGYTSAELRGMTFAAFTHPDDCGQDLELFQQLRNGQREAYHLEKPFVRKDGSVVRARLAVSLVRGPGGEPQFSIGMLVDITAEKQAQARLAKSEARYRQLMEQAADGIFLVDAHGVIREVNASAGRLLGYPREELLTMPLMALIAPEDLAALPLRLDTRQPGQVMRGERQMLRRDGTRITVDVSMSTLAEGLMLGVVRDVTEQRRAADALRESEERYRMLVEASPLPIGVHQQGRLVYVNAAALRLTGADAAEQVVGKPMLSFVHPESRARVAERARLAAEHGQRMPLAEAKLLRLDGSARDVEVATMPITYAGQPAVQVVMHDITHRKRAEELLRHEALHDRLTGLGNRALLTERLQAACQADPSATGALALMIIDLDRFKEVNDTFGHAVGDMVLCEVAARWRAVLAEAALLARLGGDEFAVLLPATDAETARQIGVRLQHALRQPFVLDGHRFEIGASIGIATWPFHGPDAERLLRHADMAMYAAKQAGSGCLVYRAEHNRHAPDRLALLSQLRQAIEQDQLVLHFQPQVSLANGRLAGVEALVRWRHPRRGLVPPDEFIPVAEQSGLIVPLSRWVLEAALRQARRWLEAHQPLVVAVNLSRRNLHDASLPETILELLQRTRLDPRWLKVEVTESTLMADPGQARQVLTRLRAMGVRVSVDDFGTGYSTLASLKDMPADELKIDRSFVRELARTAADRAIVRSTIGLAHDLGLAVVAEGVEDRATWDVLAGLGCDQAQGYLITRPLPSAELGGWLRAQAIEPVRSRAA